MESEARTHTNKSTTRNIKTSEVGWEGAMRRGENAGKKGGLGPSVEKMLSKYLWIKVPFCRSRNSLGILEERARERG